MKLNEVKDTKSKVQYAVVRVGGSIGEKTARNAKELKGTNVKNGGDRMGNNMYPTRELARERASALNKLLSPGEKKSYGIKYVVVPTVDGVAK